MKEGKPFFYRIVAADLLAEIVQIPEGNHREWLYQFGLDLVNGKGSTDYSKKVIAEVQEYRQQQAENAGKRWKDKKKRENRVAMRAITEPIRSHMGGNGNSSSSSSNNSSTETEALKPKKNTPPGNGKFIPPTLDEVRIFCEGRKNNIDPESFFHHYEARNWIPKGYTKQMSSWKSTIITWEKNQKVGVSEHIENPFEALRRQRNEPAIS